MLLVASHASASLVWPGMIPLPDDSTGKSSVYTEQTRTHFFPGRGAFYNDKKFGGVRIWRIGGDSASTETMRDGNRVRWGAIARHVYSKNQPWTRDQSLCWIENRPPTKNRQSPAPSPTKLVLATDHFAVANGVCPRVGLWDFRLDPRASHQFEAVNISKNGDTLSVIDIFHRGRTPGCGSGVRIAAYHMPQHATGFGDGEGNLSWNGRWLALWKGRRVWVVDRDSLISGKSWPYIELTDSLYGGDVLDISNVSISPLGGYVNVHYSQRYKPSGSYRDGQRILVHDKATHRLSLKNYGPDIAGCSAFRGMSDRGWVYPMKHADMTTDSLGREEYLVGGRSCNGEPTARGHVVAWRLSDGQLVFLTRGADAGGRNQEASVMHVSCRNYLRPGWAYVTYDDAPGGFKFQNEVVAVRVEGPLRGYVQRFGQIHNLHPASGGGVDDTTRYKLEPQAVPSPDGRIVMVSSNWAKACSTFCQSVTNPRVWVLDARAGYGGALRKPKRR